MSEEYETYEPPYMQDALVSLKTAKLAKGKGFNISTYYYWGWSVDSWPDHFWHGIRSNYFPSDPHRRPPALFDHNNWVYKEEWSQPTQSLLARWLREEHKIHITVDCMIHRTNQTWRYLIKGCKKQVPNTCIWDNQIGYSSYENAMEVGLQAALRLICLQ